MAIDFRPEGLSKQHHQMVRAIKQILDQKASKTFRCGFAQ